MGPPAIAHSPDGKQFDKSAVFPYACRGQWLQFPVKPKSVDNPVEEVIESHAHPTRSR